VIPLHTQHYLLLQRNLLYTGITRGRQLVVLVAAKKPEPGGATGTTRHTLHGAGAAIASEIRLAHAGPRWGRSRSWRRER